MTTTILIIGVILSLCWSIATLIQLLGTYVSLPLFRQRKVVYSGIFWEPISILKPLKGEDANLKENLSSFFNLDYPSYEIIFSVSSTEDSAYKIVNRILEENPKAPAKLIVQPVDLGPNPKVNNMVKAYELAQNDLILISDSNVRATSDYLKRLASPMRDKRVGMVTAVITGFSEVGVGGKLESIFLNTFYARWMRVLFLLGRPCVVGKSMLFRKSVAKRFGGVKVLARYLAEDYMAGEAIRRLGLKVVLAPESIYQCIGKLTLKQFWSRHVRWGRIRKSQVLIAFVIEPLFGAFISGVTGAMGFKMLYGIDPVLFFILHMGLWFLLEVPLLLRSQKKLKETDLFFWLIRETLAFPLWLNIALGNTVDWRGNKLKLEPGGLLSTAHS